MQPFPQLPQLSDSVALSAKSGVPWAGSDFPNTELSISVWQLIVDLTSEFGYDQRDRIEELTMLQFSKLAKVLSVVLASAICVAAFGATQSVALDDPPKPKVDCTKKANKNKPQCKTGYSGLTDDELYNAAYWLARQGSYTEALSLLSEVENQIDPRVLNATGFATRKLGNVDAALPYYARALAIDPNYTKAREYLGEAHLAKGELVLARVQLQEIETRCGRTCSGYAELANEIGAFEGQIKLGG